MEKNAEKNSLAQTEEKRAYNGCDIPLLNISGRIGPEEAKEDMCSVGEAKDRKRKEGGISILWLLAGQDVNNQTSPDMKYAYTTVQ